MALWKFKPFTEDDTRENPTQSQFFTTNEVKNISNGLIREGIQNALDEQLEKENPVVIKITICNAANGLEPSQYFKYLSGLEEHLYSTDNALRDLPNLTTDKMGFLVFEDFNTKGLRGNPVESKDVEISDKSQPHNFYYFWRNVGITGKAEDTLGRWGIGKTVFPASSRINTFWGLTIQSDTKEELLLGQSILRKHNITSMPAEWGYRPYGYFGSFNQDSFFSRPVTEKRFLSDFKNDFQIKRDTESGLSLIVPFYKQEITKEQIIYAVIKQYFLPIIKNNLVVEIHVKNECFRLDKEKAREIIRHLHNDSPVEEDTLSFDKIALNSLFDFTEWAIGLPNDMYYSLKSPKVNNQPRWNEALWSELNLETLIEAFEKSGRIAFKVPVKYHKKGDALPPKICWFKVFLEKDENLKKPEDHFIRENITIIDVKSLETQSIRAIALIEDKDLSNLLGDSENPAHTQWQKDSQNFINKYEDGDKCIAFIVRSIQKIYSKLQRPAKGLDKEILKELFFLETSEEDTKPVEADDDSKKDEETKKPKIDVDSKNIARIRVKKIKEKGGLIIYTDDSNIGDIDYISLKVAYMTTRGKPLNKYLEYDFELNKKPIVIDHKKCDIVSCRKNVLVFRISKSDFQMNINGFDIKRDLFVKLDIQYKDHDQEI